MTRLCLVNHRDGISSGVFFDRSYAEHAIAMLEGEFPGTSWEVVTIQTGFKPEGFRHLGEHGVRKRLSETTEDNSP